MVTVSVSTIIRRPMKEVFDFVADMRNDPRWAPLVSDVEQIAGEGPGVGATWRYTQRVGKRRVPMEIEMTTYERPALLAWRMERKTMTYRSSMLFAPHRDGTSVQQTTVETFQGAWWVPFVAVVMVRRTLRRQMRLLKRELEKVG